MRLVALKNRYKITLKLNLEFTKLFLDFSEMNLDFSKMKQRMAERLQILPLQML